MLLDTIPGMRGWEGRKKNDQGLPGIPEPSSVLAGRAGIPQSVLGSAETIPSLQATEQSRDHQLQARGEGNLQQETPGSKEIATEILAPAF